MSIKRLRARVPNANFLNIATLKQHSLRFHKLGTDNSAKCDAFFTGEDSEIVYGVLFDIPNKERPALDTAEGLGFSYNDKQVEVVTSEGKVISALTYYALGDRVNTAPYDWYLNHVLTGAIENGLPQDYIKTIDRIHSTPDPDRQRSEREFAIHNR